MKTGNHHWKHRVVHFIFFEFNRFNDGRNNCVSYCFYNWSLVDIFVYFSHHFVTIPPLSWITASHKNGVPCFGTFIIEGWADYETSGDCGKIKGTQLVQQVLKDANQVDAVVESLVS